MRPFGSASSRAIARSIHPPRQTCAYSAPLSCLVTSHIQSARSTQNIDKSVFVKQKLYAPHHVHIVAEAGASFANSGPTPKLPHPRIIFVNIAALSSVHSSSVKKKNCLNQLFFLEINYIFSISIISIKLIHFYTNHSIGKN